jgi:thiamine phosphate synthase YjbQ (UPF0047 family)
MIRVLHNSAGSGDWVQVWNDTPSESILIHEGHSISPNDLVDILNNLITEGFAVKHNVTDEDFE